MYLRRVLVLTLLLLSAAGCDRAPRQLSAEPCFDAFADGAFLPRDPWLDVAALYHFLKSDDDNVAWSVAHAQPIEVEDGWGGAEDWGAWGMGERTRFRFLLREAKAYDFVIDAMGPPGVTERPQNVRIVVNGTDAGSFAAEPDWTRHRFPIAEDLLQRGWNELELDYDYHLDGSMENDDRPLALGFERLGLVPSGEEAPRAGLSPGSRVFRDQEVVVLEASGHYVVPLELDDEAVNLELEVKASGGGEKSLDVGVMTINGEEQSLARVSGDEPELNLPLAEYRGQPVLLTFETDLPVGSRFTLREPRLAKREAARPATMDAAAEKVPIVLIVLDAARVDHFGVYGYERDTTPAIDALAAESLVFRNTVAECSYTLCSMPSLLTGLSFVQHGMILKQLIMKDEVTTLAEKLRDAGYLTIGYTGNPNNSSVTGTQQGFDEHYEIWKSNPRFITRQVGKRLRRKDVGAKPLLLMLHYVPPHEPYDPEPAFDLFGDPGYDGPVTSDREFAREVYNQKVTLDEADLAELVSLYDGNLRMADAMVARVLATLKEVGLYDKALVIVTSDHGEAFLEHGRVGHNTTVYGEMMRVPLIMKLPASWKHRAQGVDLERLTTLADVPATIYGQLGIEPPEAVRATDLLAGSGGSAQRMVFLRSASGDRPILGVRTQRFKAVMEAESMPEVYDLEQDPDETSNVIVEHPLLHTGLRLLLARAIRAPEPLRAGVRQGEIAEKDKAMLEALGYL